MENERNFVVNLEKNENINYYLLGVKNLFLLGSSPLKSFTEFKIKGKMEEGYDALSAYQNFLTSDSFVEIKYAPREDKGSFKLDCKVFFNSEEKVNMLESEIKGLCGVKI